MSGKRKRFGCKISGCMRIHFGLGYCKKHYYRRKCRMERGLPIDDLSLSITMMGAPKGDKNCNWKGGASEYPDHSRMKKIRLEVLKEANYTCQRCGGYTKEVHHLDKSKNNHDKSNFLAVCHKCHIGEFHRDVVGRPLGGKNKVKVMVL